MSNDSNRVDVAVFIDFENVYVSVRDKLDANPNFESIMDRCEDFGRVVIARAYADWYRYPRITSALYANAIEPMYVPTYYYDREQGRTGRAIKNSVDMNLCVDAMRTLYANPNIAKFVLATGDRDFIPLVNAIRQQGKEVIVIGIGGAASSHLAQSADEFLFYESLVGKPAATLLPDQPRAKMPEKGRENANGDTTPEPQREPTPDIYDVLVQAIHMARDRGYVCSFGSLKLLMKELTGGEFKESRYKDAAGRPFAKFKDFVLEGERRGKVQVFTSGTVNEVFLPGEDPYTLSQFAQDLQAEEQAAEEVPPAPAEEARTESRNPATNGRRRRRRPRGGQRQATMVVTESEMLLNDDEDEEVEEQVPLPEEPLEEVEAGVPEEVITSNFESEEQADAVFERLLERVEDELTDTPEAVQTPMEEISPGDVSVEPAAVAGNDGETAAAPATGAEQPQAQVGRPFEPREWQMLRTTVARFERPVSFAQIYDALREARNREQIDRTNEDLRSLTKQAINSGILERIGKGTRISYRLAPLTEEATEGETATVVEAESSEMAQLEQAPAPEETVDQTAMIEQAEPQSADALAVNAAIDPTAEFEQAEQGEGTPPAAEAQPEQASASEEAVDQTALIEQAEPQSEDALAVNAAIDPTAEFEQAVQGEGVSTFGEVPMPEANEQAAEIEQADMLADQQTFTDPEGTTEPADEATEDTAQTTLIEQAGDGAVEFATSESLPEAVVPEATAEPVAEEPPATSKRTRRRTTRKANNEMDEAAAAVEAAPEATEISGEAAGETPAKPKRARRRATRKTDEQQNA